MTVSYTNEIATTTSIGIFWKLLGRWKGSIYKLIWREVILFSCLYYIIKMIYEYALENDQKILFAAVVKYCRYYSTSIPLSFVLGFYVNLVMDRWWQQYKSLPWPDTLGIQVSSMVEGLDERSRMMRRTIMRYVNLSYVMALTIISPRVKLRFPTMDELEEEGFIEPNERQIIDNLGKDIPHSLYWLPLVWAASILKRAKNEKLIQDELSLKTMMDSITEFRSGLASLLGFHTISIPLVYTQVVTLAVYSFFAGSLISSQYVGHLKTVGVVGEAEEINDTMSLGQKPQLQDDQTDLIIPWFTLLQYLFYVGWLKVAETLVNPFGTDDDDFELNILIDRNFQVGYLIVDTMHDQYPELIQDKYWEDIMPRKMPPTPDFSYKRYFRHESNTDSMKSRAKPFTNDNSGPYLSQVMRSALNKASLLRREHGSNGTHDSPQKLMEDGEMGEQTPLKPFVLPLDEDDAERDTIPFADADSVKNV